MFLLGGMQVNMSMWATVGQAGRHAHQDRGEQVQKVLAFTRTQGIKQKGRNYFTAHTHTEPLNNPAMNEDEEAGLYTPVK